MEKEFRTIVFVIPAALSAAVDASEMAVDFLSKVDWLADEVGPLGTEIRGGILQAARGSLRAGHQQVAVSIDVFREDCVIRVSQQGCSAKQFTIHLRRCLVDRPDSAEELPVSREVFAS